MGEVSSEEGGDSIQIAGVDPAIIAVDQVKMGIGQRKHARGEVEEDIRLAPKRGGRTHAKDKLGLVEGLRRSKRIRKS